MAQLGLGINDSNPIARDRSMLPEQYSSFEFEIGRCDAVASNQPAHRIGYCPDEPHGCQGDERPELTGLGCGDHEENRDEQWQLGDANLDKVNPDDPAAKPLPRLSGVGDHVASPRVASVRAVSSSATRAAVCLSNPPISMAP